MDKPAATRRGGKAVKDPRRLLVLLLLLHADPLEEGSEAKER
jgi:hypothetical protein